MNMIAPNSPLFYRTPLAIALVALALLQAACGGAARGTAQSPADAELQDDSRSSVSLSGSDTPPGQEEMTVTDHGGIVLPHAADKPGERVKPNTVSTRKQGVLVAPKANKLAP
jgi:hypothetical protein